MSKESGAVEAGTDTARKRREPRSDPWFVALARQIDESARAVVEVSTDLTKRVIGKQPARQSSAKGRKEALELLEIIRARLADSTADPTKRLTDTALKRAIERLQALRPWMELTPAAPVEPAAAQAPAPPPPAQAKNEEEPVEAQIRDEPIAKEAERSDEKDEAKKSDEPEK